MDDNRFICEFCTNEVGEDDEYCSNCGALFNHDLTCFNHVLIPAEGVCLICQEPYCAGCGDMIDDTFLCREHEHYEIIQNHARIRGGSFEAELQYFKDCLKQEGLHPVIFNRKMSPLHLGGTDYTMFRAAGDYNGHFVNEIKLMVPCAEVLKAEKILRELEKNNAETDLDIDE